MERFFVGVDGGGTRTRAVAAGADLVPRGRGASGPANAASTPLPGVIEAVREAVEDALTAACLPLATLSRVACGIAGVEGSGLGARLAEALEAVYGAGKVLVTTDAQIALAGASEGPPGGAGVVLIAGTGAVAFGRNAQGEETRAGGWGPLIGDEGSGYSIAARGLAAVVRDLDGRGPKTAMRDLLFKSEGLRSPAELVQKLYRSASGPGDLAAYFPVVLLAARQGDEAAREILREAGEELALAAETVITQLSLQNEEFPVATVGGVFTAGELVLAPLRRRLLEIAPEARLGPPAYAPEVGAIRMALAEEARAA